MNGELIALHERLTAFATQPVPDPEAGWADLRVRLRERRRRPFLLRSRRWVVALAAAVLSSGVAYAALESGRRVEEADRDRVQRVEPRTRSPRDTEPRSGAANLPAEGDGGLGGEDGTPETPRRGVLPEREHEADDEPEDPDEDEGDEGDEGDAAGDDDREADEDDFGDDDFEDSEGDDFEEDDDEDDPFEKSDLDSEDDEPEAVEDVDDELEDD